MEVEKNEFDTKESLLKTKYVILVISGKGGVGKSTLTALLAATYARKGCRVGLLDIDLCGPSIPFLLGVENKSVLSSQRGWIPVVPEHPEFQKLSILSLGLLLKSRDDAVVWRGPKKSSMIKQFLSQVLWGELDYLIIDTPPGTSDEHITVVEYLQTNFPSFKISAILVTTPQHVSLIDVQKEIDFCRNVSLKIEGLFENMSGYVCPHCAECTQIFGSGGGKSLCELQDIPFLGYLPIDPRLSAYLAQNTSFFDAYVTVLENGGSISAIIDHVVRALSTADTLMLSSKEDVVGFKKLRTT
jgi:Mrp family chromosome partitioning ATPase